MRVWVTLSGLDACRIELGLKCVVIGSEKRDGYFIPKVTEDMINEEVKEEPNENEEGEGEVDNEENPDQPVEDSDDEINRVHLGKQKM